MGGGPATATGSGYTGKGGGRSGSTARISRCGLPHLWQNSASSGSVAPQVQRSGTISVWHVILWVANRIEFRAAYAAGNRRSGRPASEAACVDPEDVRMVVTRDPDQLRELAPQADVLFNAEFFDAKPLLATFPLATRARWVHAISAGVERLIAVPEIR